MIFEPSSEASENKVNRAQRLRLRRFGLSVATYCVALLATFLVTRLGLGELSSTQWLMLIGLMLLGLTLLFVLFRSAANLRFAEPSLTREQIIFSAIVGSLIMYWLPQPRPTILLFFIPPLSFGMLSLNLRKYLVVVAWVLGIYAALLVFEFWQSGSEYNIKYQLYLFGLFSILLIWFAFFGGFVSNIKKRLRTQKLETQKALDLIKIEIAERRQAEKALAESDSLRELLLDIITHDLKNPASVIYGLAEFAQSSYPEDEIVDGIYSTSKSLLKVLENTTTLSQATFGEKIPREDLNLNEVISHIEEEFSAVLRAADMRIENRLPAPLVVQANPLIAEVFKNYISNAIKYASVGKRIVLEAVIEVETLVIKVIDFGNTIPTKQRDFIFERQTQLGEGEKRGRGLGLAIVKRIASAHSGEAWVEPNTPMGNQFCLRLPYSQPLPLQAGP